VVVVRGQAAARDIVKIAVEQFAAGHEDAVAAFNTRMERAHAPFLLPARAKPALTKGAVTIAHYVAVDETGQVRGGMKCQTHPARLGDADEQTVNIQAPLSEGIVNPAFTMVGPQLVKYAQRLSPHAFAVGMGKVTHPFAQLLKAMGWMVLPVPFYFRLLRGARCAKHLAPLRSSPARRLAADLAAMTGVANFAPAFAHRAASAAVKSSARFRATPVEKWPQAADAIWHAFATTISFGVLRTTGTLPFFYDGGPRSPRVWALERDGAAEGWFGLLVASMSGNEYFGDLVVATLTDCIGTPEAIRAGVILAAQTARERGADLVITNQQHRLLREACVAAGWRQAPSNYLFAASRSLTNRLQVDTLYFTRRDGDGLLHLGGG
jgi:hypothetical protein